MSQSEMWALLYLHDWDPPKEGQEHRWEPGKNVFPDIHAIYDTRQEAATIRAKMANPGKYWVRRAHGRWVDGLSHAPERPQSAAGSSEHQSQGPANRAPVTDGSMKPGDRLSYVLDEETKIGRITAHTRPIEPVIPASVREALIQAETYFELIRLKLINNLQEPERSAFWLAVEARNAMSEALSEAAQDCDADLPSANDVRGILGSAKMTILTNPEDTWDAYCAEVAEQDQSPQGAMAFAIDRLTEALNPPQTARTEAAVELVEALNDIEISAYNAAKFRIGKALALLTGESQCQAESEQ